MLMVRVLTELSEFMVLYLSKAKTDESAYAGDVFHFELVQGGSDGQDELTHVLGVLVFFHCFVVVG